MRGTSVYTLQTCKRIVKVSSKAFSFDIRPANIQTDSQGIPQIIFLRYIRHHSVPRFDAIYSTVEQCQAACATEVPRCNSVNYAPAKVLNRCERLLRIEWLVVELMTTGRHSLHCFFFICIRVCVCVCVCVQNQEGQVSIPTL